MKRKKSKLGIKNFFLVEKSYPTWWFVLVIYFVVCLAFLLMLLAVVLISEFTPWDLRDTLYSIKLFDTSLAEWPTYIFYIPGYFMFLAGFIILVYSAKELWGRRGCIKYHYPEFKKLCDEINARAGFCIDAKDFYTWRTRNAGNTFDISQIKNCSTTEYMTVKEMLEKISQIFYIHDYWFECNGCIDIRMVSNEGCGDVALDYVLYAYVKEHQLFYERTHKYGVLYDKNKNKIYYDEKIGFFYM